MKNLFIVHTPFNLMTAFILSKSIFVKDENYLAIMHPQSYSSWEEEPILRYMSSVECGYKKVFPFLRLFRSGQGSYQKQAKEAINMIGNIDFDRIFLGMDIDIQAQLLVALLGKTKYYRFDEGMWSYYYGGHQRTWLDEKFHLMQLKSICLLAGIKTKLEFNAYAIGYAKAASGDYLYKPELLKRESPEVNPITNEMIKEAVEDLKKRSLLKQQFDKKTIIYLSQPLVEKGEINEKEELAALLDLEKSIGGGTQFLYKPHARDSKEKIDKYKKAIPNMKIYASKIPIELVYSVEPNLEAVISYASSGLMFGGKFAGKEIKMFSLAGLCKKKIEKDAIEILQNAGVVFVN